MRPPAAFLLALCLSACSASIEGSAKEVDDPAAFVLQTYEVPPGYESRVEDVLNRLFWRAENVPPLGKANPGAPGTVIVAAPQSVQDDVKGVIAGLNKIDTKAAEARNVRLSYWMIGGTRASAVDTSALPAAIAPAMAEVAGVEAPMRYSVLVQESLLSLDGAHARVTRADLEIRQVVSVRPNGGIVADIDIDSPGGVGTETQVQLVSGQVLVLGQTSTGGGRGPEGTSDAIFYVVRPESDPAQ